MTAPDSPPSNQKDTEKKAGEKKDAGIARATALFSLIGTGFGTMKTLAELAEGETPTIGIVRAFIETVGSALLYAFIGFWTVFLIGHFFLNNMDDADAGRVATWAGTGALIWGVYKVFFSDDTFFIPEAKQFAGVAGLLFLLYYVAFRHKED